MATAAELVHWISTTLGDFPAATNGLWRAGDGRPLQRLAVALAGSEPVAEAALSASVDALLLHRPWGLGPLPDAVAVIAAHEALDARLTTGHNPWLAARLGFTLVSSIGERDGWPLVAVAERGDAMPIAAFWQRLRTECATWQLWNDHALPTPLRCIALANAMRPALVRGAAAAGAQLYLTGSLRPSAASALRESGMVAVGLGHAPPERWGLRWLATEIAARFEVAVVELEE
ncbi:MAG: Nif3-like dinuclear metal center hexameric protein [Anaerolineales bacterium]|nr:Nif3-like dinuclear metal center hexameric protein [Anaerolineales bacterium]MCB9127296.1 Nif3-like dinuclear metal center hexameric protein [Ardenticatenales bacterium]MCB9172585.1 Nif3-like dinuclear metal center hexameric protein [Ardenticatenales bacterium]